MRARQELLDTLKEFEYDLLQIKCAFIRVGDPDYHDNTTAFVLKVNPTLDEIKTFLDSLDFVYDNGYGGQVLFGNVWLNDGTWFERGEYDGSEWWEYKSVPIIPAECMSIRMFQIECEPVEIVKEE